MGLTTTNGKQPWIQDFRFGLPAFEQYIAISSRLRRGCPRDWGAAVPKFPGLR